MNVGASKEIIIKKPSFKIIVTPTFIIIYLGINWNTIYAFTVVEFHGIFIQSKNQ